MNALAHPSLSIAAIQPCSFLEPNPVFGRQRGRLYLSRNDIARLAHVPLAIVRDVEAARVPQAGLIDLRDYFHRMADLLETPFAELYPADYLARILRAASHRTRFNWTRERPLTERDQVPEEVDVENTAVAHIIRTTQRQWLLAALADLPAPIRRVLELRFGIDSGHLVHPDGICRLERISPAVYRRRVRSGLGRLRRAWQAGQCQSISPRRIQSPLIARASAFEEV